MQNVLFSYFFRNGTNATNCAPSRALVLGEVSIVVGCTLSVCSKQKPGYGSTHTTVAVGFQCISIATATQAECFLVFGTIP
jgi:hypothetical protein